MIKLSAVGNQNPETEYTNLCCEQTISHKKAVPQNEDIGWHCGNLNSKGEKQAESMEETVKHFNKYICFSNIRELLKDSPVKIGQIEKEAGCQPGYMSRLDKSSNTSEPSVEFIVTAAKMLGVSLDVLLMTDLTQMTPTEKYLVSFFEKLYKDTLDEKLEWKKETAESLRKLARTLYCPVEHPLFSYKTFMQENENGEKEETSGNVFESNSFGTETKINGTCFHLKMKKDSVLYLMDIRKSIHRINDRSAFVKEIWMYSPAAGSQFLAGNKDGSNLAPFVDKLFGLVSKHMNHPKIKKELKSVIDAFMQDNAT